LTGRNARLGLVEYDGHEITVAFESSLLQRLPVAKAKFERPRRLT
jgi:hypothetical protein